VRVALVGVSGAGKRNYADQIRELIPHLDISTQPQPWHDEALGALADYRVELRLAIQRAYASLNLDHIIFTHTLVDSLAYVHIRQRNVIEGNDDQRLRWAITGETVGLLFGDSFSADFVFYLPPTTDDPWTLDLDRALHLVMDFYEILPRQVDAEEAAEVIRESFKSRSDS